MRKSFLSGLFFLAGCPILFASTVVLKSGEKIEGSILGTSKEEIYFQSDTRILNYPYRDIREITDFSAEEIQKGYGEEVIQGLEISSAPLAEAKEIVSREFTQDQLKEKMRAFKEFILKHFTGGLKSDEKEVLQSLGEALDKPVPLPVRQAGAPRPAEKNSAIEEVLARYAPFQSDLHEKILNLMMRYLNEWILDAQGARLPDGQGRESFVEEEPFLLRTLGKTRLAILRSVLPSMETVRDNIRRRLANIAEQRTAAEAVGAVQL